MTINPADWLILNIDDQQAIRYAKTRALQRAGYKVIEAASGTEGLECVASHSPALVMCDVKMPDMSGLEVCRLIKERHPGTLVLQVSASFVTAHDRALGLDVGADSYLTEPVEPEELIAAVHALLRMKLAETELRIANDRQNFIVDIADRLRGLESSEAIMMATAEALARRLQVNRVGFFRIVGDELNFGTGWSDGRFPPLSGKSDRRDLGEALNERIGEGRIIVIDDARHDPAVTTDIFAKSDARAVLGVPLTRAGKWDGGLYVTHAEPRAWSADDISLVGQVAQMSWVAIGRAQALDDLQVLNESLERQVEARTRELLESEGQLRQSQKMEAIGQLTGGLAHDFNNMLTGIIGGLAVVRRRIAKGDTGAVDDVMDAVTASAQRAAALTHRLLAYARRQALDFKAVDVARLLTSLAELLQRTLGERIKMVTTVEPGLWSANTDANQLETALLNLIINARDAMADGGDLTIQAANASIAGTPGLRRDGILPGDYVVLSVADSGTGIPADVLEKVFDPFFTTKPIGQGTGLGLSMVYGFMRQSGGHVRVESEVGKGTIVKLYLPRHSGAVADGEAAKAAFSEKRHGESILLVEDDPSVRLVIANALQDIGYSVMVAADGNEAVQMLESEQPIDLLVSDVGLPGMNGRRVAEIAREKRPGLKVLFITGYAEGAADRVKFLGPDMEMLSKPFELTKFTEKVRAMIES
jgi:signal transduction histidine kinase/CheY-like chemotaxis protein